MSLMLTIKFLFVTLFIATVKAAPYKLKNEPLAPKNCSDSENDESPPLIDQRQKGKGNYRISVKDFVLIWAPSDVLLTAAALLDSQLLGSELFGSEDTSNFGKPQEIENQESSIENKPSQNSSVTVDDITNEGDNITVNAQKLKRPKFPLPALVRSILKKS